MAGKNSRVIVRIREMILHGELVPGERVREVELANKLGVSRTPVRESLPILAQEGVLTQLDTRGFVIVEGSGSKVIADAIERNSRIPFAAAHAIAFDRVNLTAQYDMLHFAHRQHHRIVEALENGEGARVAALMFEHAYMTKKSINISRASFRPNPEAATAPPEEPVNRNGSDG